jgi:polyphosphate kinase
MEIIISKEKLDNIINENFFRPEDNPLDDFYESAKDLLSNLRTIIRHKHKVQFFVNRLKKSAIRLKHINNISTVKLHKIINSLLNDYDKDIVKEFGILGLLKNIDEKKKNKYIDNFVENLDAEVEELIVYYNNKINTDKEYDVFNIMKGAKNMITPREYHTRIFELQIELLKLQEWVVENNKRVLIIFEGRDAAGKSANIEAFTQNLNPKHYRVETFDIPTEEEKQNWFKRYIKVLPKPGEIVFFDRSWYNRGIIEPAMGYCTPEQHAEFMDDVNDFEEWVKNNGIIVFKFWLDIEKDKQVARFEMRKRDPLRYWKYSENDEKILKKWDVLSPYIQRVLDETNEHVPWKKIQSDDKLNGILETITTVLKEFNYDFKNYELFQQTEFIIFLDFHGVVITKIYKDKKGRHDCFRGFNRHAIKNLNKLCEITGGKIVLITNCKNYCKYDDLVQKLHDEGFKGEIAGKTIEITPELRADQIDMWFKTNGKPRQWVVLDDKPYEDYKEFPEHIVRPKLEIGFQEKELKKALKIYHSKNEDFN